MGTVWNQPMRESFDVTTEDTNEFIEECLRIAQKNKIELSDVINARHVLEMKRKNDLYRWNGDSFDEQVSGLATILQNIAEKINP